MDTIQSSKNVQNVHFDGNGNFIPGIHRIDLDSFQNIFIGGINGSTTRQRNLDGFKDFFSCPYMEKYREIITRVWLDGSFCTAKTNPNDIDGVMFLDPHPSKIQITNEFLEAFPKWHQEAHDYYYSDLYPIYDVDSLKQDMSDYLNLMPQNEVINLQQKFDSDMKYWMGQFTFDRERNPKGIFEIIVNGGALS